MCTAEHKKLITMKQYFCFWRMKKPPNLEESMCVRRRKKKLIRCVVGVGNPLGTQV